MHVSCIIGFTCGGGSGFRRARPNALRGVSGFRDAAAQRAREIGTLLARALTFERRKGCCSSFPEAATGA